MTDTQSSDRSFDKDLAQQGIHEICRVCDELGLTLPERFWAFKCLEVSCAALMGEKLTKLLEEDLKVNEE